ncbi:MAG: rubrerythrin-like domain-containing protein [Halobacteriaceae archaeon]
MVEYECRSCGERVERSPYRSTCPACGGQLRRRGRQTA